MKETNQIPYLASIIISQDVDEKVLDDFKDPTKYDLLIYNQYGKSVWDRILETQTPTQVSPPKLSHPTPVPTPATGAPMSLPLPTYAGPPSSYMIPPPVMAVPPPVAISYPAVPVPAPLVPSFSVAAPKQNHSNIIPISTSSSSRLAKEFFKEKDTILIDDTPVEKEKQKNYESLLKTQLQAQELMRSERTRKKSGPAPEILPDPKDLVSDSAMSTIEKAIQNLDREIRDKVIIEPKFSSKYMRANGLLRSTLVSDDHDHI